MSKGASNFQTVGKIHAGSFLFARLQENSSYSRYYAFVRIGKEPWDVFGTAGMLDLVLSLEWIRDNITAFGGDPDKVTVSDTRLGTSSIHRAGGHVFVIVFNHNGLRT